MLLATATAWCDAWIWSTSVGASQPTKSAALASRMAADSLRTPIVYTTYAGDGLLTSVGTADGDGPIHTGLPGR
jgi:hypothetical protein